MAFRRTITHNQNDGCVSTLATSVAVVIPARMMKSVIIVIRSIRTSKGGKTAVVMTIALVGVPDRKRKKVLTAAAARYSMAAGMMSGLSCYEARHQADLPMMCHINRLRTSEACGISASVDDVHLYSQSNSPPTSVRYLPLTDLTDSQPAQLPASA